MAAGVFGTGADTGPLGGLVRGRVTGDLGLKSSTNGRRRPGRAVTAPAAGGGGGRRTDPADVPKYQS
ncbi:hypothetical protein GCM10027570_02670 [Streptomonospora sediminis]